MKYRHILALLLVGLWPASGAQAQFGLYGSPGMVELPPRQLPLSELPGFLDRGYGDFREGHLGHSAYTASMPESLAAEPLPVPAADAPTIAQPEPDAPSVVDQMLQESGTQLSAPSQILDPGCGWGPWQGYGQASCAEEVADCGDPFCDLCFTPKWYVSASGLIMSRDRANRLWTTYESGNNANQLPTDESWGWRGGGEVRFGRTFCCGTWALEATYWMLDPFTSVVSQTNANGVSSPFDFTDMTGFPENYFDGAAEHRVWRRSEVYNVELNLIRNPVDCGCWQALDFNWAVGVRYFKFDDNTTFGSLAGGGIAFGIDPTMEGYLEDDIENHLVGAQFSFGMNYRRGNWRLYMTPKVGIYNNHMKNHFDARDGTGVRFGTAPPDYPGYPVDSTADAVSFLTEIDLGLEWQFTPKWSAHIGYRVLAATGMGLADEQFTPYPVDTPEIADIDHNGHLLLHGAMAGFGYRF